MSASSGSLSASSYRIHMRPEFAPYPVRADDCEHPAHVTMFVGQKHVKPKRGKPYVAMQAVVCMDCGCHKGPMPIEVALRTLWDQYGWNRVIGKRLCQLSVRVARQLRSESSSDSGRTP